MKTKRSKNDRACRTCGKDFPLTMKIEGKKRSLSSRLNCLECVPWGTRNNRAVVVAKNTCAHCGAPTDNPKYCSNECSAEASRKGLIDLTSPKGIRQYLLRTREHRCQMCQNTEWLGEPIALEVDHIDGDSDNNVEENLRLICPNCHATTPQWKNRGGSQHTSKRKYRRDRYAAGKTW